MLSEFVLSSLTQVIQHADNAQQAFSSDRATTLHLALPALEALHKAWTKCAERSKYIDFVPALNAGLQKIEEYYSRTAECDAYTFAMRSLTSPLFSSILINLFQCSIHHRKRNIFASTGVTTNWKVYSSRLRKRSVTILCAAWCMFNKLFLQYKTRYLEMYSNSSTLAPPQQKTGKSATRKIGTLIRELSDDEDEDEVDTSTIAPNELRAPWCKDFNGYLNSKDQLGDMSIVEWWGVSISRIFLT